MDMAVVNFLRNRQMTVLGPIDDIDRKLMVWRSWYLGKVDGFHDYPIYNGRIKRNVERKSLHMAKRVAQRWADLLLNEKVEVNAAVPGLDGAPARGQCLCSRDQPDRDSLCHGRRIFY